MSLLLIIFILRNGITKWRKKIVLFTLFAMNLVDQPAPEVIIEQGTLTGKISKDGTFYEYIGIPYATTNSSTRFQAPSPPPKFEGVFRATESIYQCPQYYPRLGVMGVEDCLKINVYVPVQAKKPLPVMVYIHGGAFILGNGGRTVHGPDFLLKHDVVVVTFNYRLGALGFTCLHLKQAPGNAGLKDQVAALRWIQKNIKAFGGDPDNVTIFGHSAGAASTALLTASDKTTGLFHKAIIQSGSALSNFAINRDPISKARRVAKLLGHDLEDTEQIYELFSKVSYKDLVLATAFRPLGQLFTAELLHLPCIEKSFDGIEPVLNDIPYNLITKHPKNIPLMYSATDKEGVFFAMDETEESLAINNKRNLFTDDLVFKTKEEEKKVAERIKRFYFGDKDVSKETVLNLADLYGHLYFEMPVILESELMTQITDAPVYNYYFTYSGGRNILKSRFEAENTPGAYHGDDILYIFEANVWPFRIKEKDQQVIDLITTTLTNFAKYGNPTPNDQPVKWEPSTKDSVNFLIIDHEVKMGPIQQPEPYRLWKKIYDEYRYTKVK